MGRLRALALTALALSITGPAVAKDAPDRQVMVVLKFAPSEGSKAAAAVALDPESCKPCRQLHDPAFERFNSREAVVQLSVPRGRYLDLAFKIGPAEARRVIVNDSDLPTRRVGDRLIVALPPLWTDAILAPALETDIVETGMVLRVETADPARRAGAYASGEFPALQRRAADNLTFALREVVRRLGLGEAVAAARTGTIMIMGFDTNFPSGHLDAPPHIHMHLRWPNNVGTQIGHYYLSDQGLLTENHVGVKAIKYSSKTYGPGETFTTVDNRGLPVYAHTITREGFLRVDRPDGASCLLVPRGKGFQDGVHIDCKALGTADVATTIDLAKSTIQVRTDDLVETLRYDPDTGKLTSRAESPEIPISARDPD